MNWKEIRKAWKVHSKELHSISINYGKQIHHIYGRDGAFECCLRFLKMLSIEDHQNKDVINALIEDYRADRLAFEENYSKIEGCKEKIFDECYKCYLKREKK